MIFINRNKLVTGIVILSLLVFSSIFLNTTNVLLSLLVFTYLITVPGFLILLACKVSNLTYGKWFLLSVGLSLFFLIFAGLIFNTFGPLLVKVAPLQTDLLVIYYGLLINSLLSIVYIRHKDLLWQIRFEPLDLLKKIYYIIPPLFTVLSIFAAIRLNNNADNILAIITLSGIAFVLLVLVLFQNRISEHFYSWTLYFFSLSLLFLISLRSWYISGWDIQSEFVVFQITKILQGWSPANMDHAYNACLSITLLPTILSKLVLIPDDYIYKFLYQILFAFTPVIIYQTYRRYTRSFTAFISAIYIISQPLFIQPMTALMRQEIAFIFFVFMSYVMFDRQLSRLSRNLLFLAFGLGMIVSHYSTTYVALILLLLTYILTVVFRLTDKVIFISWIYQKLRITDRETRYNYFINPIVLILLLGFTVFWYGRVNNQLGKVQQVATDGIDKMQDLFKAEVKSGESRKAFTFLQSDITTVDKIEAYIAKMRAKVGGDAYKLYPPQSYLYSDVYPIQPPHVAPLFVSSANNSIILALEFLKQIFKIGVILGPLYIFIRYFRSTVFPREYIILCGAAVLIVMIMTFHPSLGVSYNLSRFYLQLLFVLSLFTVLFISFILAPLKKGTTYVVGVLLVILYMYLSGLPYQVIGGEARMYLNNFGPDYNKFYVHKTELAAAEWMKKNTEKGATVYADQEANLRIYRAGNGSKSVNFNVLPRLIYKDAYVYGSYANIMNGYASVYDEGNILIFSFPKKFLEENKNTIYSNGSSTIYK